MKGIRLISWALCLVLFCSCLALGEGYRTLEEGMRGEDVYQLKLRLEELGYVKHVTGLNENYSAGTAEYVRRFQAANGLEETGIATPELQELIYSAGCVTADGEIAQAAKATPAPVKEAAPAVKPAASPLPDQAGPELPETDAEGYLLPGAEPYIYASRDQGLWYYIAQDLRIEIHRYSNPSIPLVWFETYVNCRNDEKIRAYVGGDGSSDSHFEPPDELNKKAGFVLATSDDFYTHRVLNRTRVGTVIRNGEILYDQQIPYGTEQFPPLDILAFFPDGAMKSYYSDEITAQELLAQGAEHSICFGPVLVRDGEMDKRVQGLTSYDYAELHPRHAIGMIAPKQYVLISVLGRRTDSQGANLKWVAQKMLELGCREAFNLDGGNTLTLVFMGEIINRAPTNTNNRPITSLIGFGDMNQ